MRGLLGTLAAAVVLGLLAATPASATYEQVATFADKPGLEESPNLQLQYATGLAVNRSGAGGVPAGTLYGIGYYNARVIRYSPQGELRASWGWGVADSKNEFQRCGPDGEAAHPVCPQKEAQFNAGIEGEGVGQLWRPTGIAVDQATGNVYVFNSGSSDTGRKHGVVQIYSADGSQLLGEFGQKGGAFNKPFETIATTPAKFHENQPSNIAVDNSGAVYIADGSFAGDQEPGKVGNTTRVMVFKPQSPGDLEHYEYTGRENDIAANNSETNYFPNRLALDDAGNLYMSNLESIYRFAPGEPDAPDCEYQGTNGGAEGMTVNPISGEVFYFNYKNSTIRQLSACNAEGEFTQIDLITLTPKPEQMRALAFDPALSYEPSRPAGILYGGQWQPSRGYIFAPPKVFPPEVVSQSVSLVGPTSATLNAQINPKGSVASYAFQYETEAQYQANEPTDRFAGASETPVGGAVLGSGQVALSTAAALFGLQPDTAYRYRVIATSSCNPEEEEEVCEETGADGFFHTFPIEAPGLPDERAWELVSPAQKNGGEVFGAYSSIRSCTPVQCKPEFARSFPMQSTPDGDALAYEGQPFVHSGGAANENSYIARRTAAGWQTTNPTPDLLGVGSGQGYEAFDASLNKGVLYQGSPRLSPEAPEDFLNLYAQPTNDPLALEPLLRFEPPNREAGLQLNLRYAGASADFSRVFFAANDALTGETPFAPEALDGGATKFNLYEWTEGQLRLVNVAPGNTETEAGTSFGSKAPDAHAISQDGSRVFFSDAAGQVYVREDAELTKEIPDTGDFLSASADGSKALLSSGRIFDVDDLGAEPIDLTQGEGGFEGLVGQSDDLSHVYFVDTAVLSGANGEGKSPLAGKDNLYSYAEGATEFIATLVPQDNTGSGPSLVSTAGDWLASPAQRTAQASPNGRWLAFSSRAQLTGYDNTGPCTEDSGTGIFHPSPCQEAFLYDSQAGELLCASCNPAGQRPLGRSNLPLIRQAFALPQPHYLTDEGRLLFDSMDSLSPFDTNAGTVPGHAVEDVYQYEPNGVGTCEREAGCLKLISAGHEPEDSNFLAMDEDGSDVFFTTRDQLVLKDKDDALDVYDARIEGGIPAETEAGRGECQGEACQPLFTPPTDPNLASTSFEGSGNVDEKKAAKKKKHKKKKKHAKQKSKKRAHKGRKGTGPKRRSD